MQIDNCLILAAGLGTRMGVIGQKLPKVLWPVFEKPLLELQVAYARSLGIKKIFVNLYYMGDSILDYCKSRQVFENVTFLLEKPEILDIGGAVHNLAQHESVKYKGSLLVLNADQFFYMKKETLDKYLSPFNGTSCLIFTHKVNSSLGYNAIEIGETGLMKKIILNKDLKPGAIVETYTGIAYIDLSKLKPVKGVSKFFESVCPFEMSGVPTVSIESVDYWDFGTLKRYWETCFKILETYRINSNHPFLRFLVAERALKTWKIDLQNISYNSTTPGFINLSPESLVGPGKSILLGQNISGVKSNHVCWNGLSEEVR